MIDKIKGNRLETDDHYETKKISGVFIRREF